MKQIVYNLKDIKTKNWFWITGIIVVTIITYISIFANGFTNWDDIQQVTNNNDIKSLSFQNIKKIFSSFYVGMYQPLPTLIFALVFSLFKLNPLYFHSLSLLIHCVNIILVYVLIMKITQHKKLPIIVSTLFAITPLNVEAVAWVSAFSTLTFSCFYLLSLLYYILYIKSNQKKSFLFLSFLFFVFSLLSKSAAVTLPVLFFLFDYYFQRKADKKVFFEKIPFFILAIIFGIITIIARKEAEHIINISSRFNLFDRFFIILHSLFIYIFKLIVPVKLSAFHPYPDKSADLLPVFYYISSIILLFLAFLVYKVWKNRKDIIWGLLFFGITISVMMEIIPVGLQVTKERYTYISSIGIYYCFGISLIFFCRERKLIYLIKKVVFIALVLGFTFVTFDRVKKWENSFTLWNDVIKNNPKISAAFINRGNAFSIQGSFIEAIKDYSEAIKLEPNAGDAYINRAMIYSKLEQYNEALSDYNNAIKIGKVDYNTYVSRGLIRSFYNDFDGAISDMNQAIILNPKDAVLFNQRGIFYGITKEYLLAFNDFTQAITLKPDYAEAMVNKGNAELNLNRLNEAISDFTKAISLNHNLASAYYYRGLTYIKLNKKTNACNDFKNALNLGIFEAKSEIVKYCNKIMLNS